jgi:hypothetical protein
MMEKLNTVSAPFSASLLAAITTRMLTARNPGGWPTAAGADRCGFQSAPRVREGGRRGVVVGPSFASNLYYLYALIYINECAEL